MDEQIKDAREVWVPLSSWNGFRFGLEGPGSHESVQYDRAQNKVLAKTIKLNVPMIQKGKEYNRSKSGLSSGSKLPRGLTAQLVIIRAFIY